jgi:hypothetical protein
MKTRSRRTVAALVACLGSIGFPVAVTAARAPDDKGLAQGLRSGGFVIVVRHGPTFADIEDGDLLPRLAKIGETRNKARLRFFDRRMAATNWSRGCRLPNGPASPKCQDRHSSTG